MSRTKAFFAMLLFAAITALVPAASAKIISKAQVAISGSSGIWQSIALAADNYNGTEGLCASLTGVVTVHPPCNHYTSTSNFDLNDTRPTLNGLGGTTNVDTGAIWIVWDSPNGTTETTRNVWFYVKVDSIVGDRCFYANPRCDVTAPSGYTWGLNTASLISPSLWGNDVTPPSDVQALFAGSGTPVDTAGSDIRPEDAQFEACRVNSALGNGVPGFGDGLDGLGYGTFSSGTCPQFGALLSQLVGTPIKSGLSGSTATANPLAFNISGHDPFTNKTVVTGNVYDVGAYPVVFVFSRSTTANKGLKGATNITSSAAQTVFSGANCDAHVIDSGIAAGTAIDVYLREPLSGTMTATEMSVFRRPVETTPAKKVLGVSQETNVGSTNPLSNTPCNSGTGARTRGIGTSEVVKGVQNSGGSAFDGIAYSFNGFGNFSHIAGSPDYGYLKLDGVDPIGPYVGEVNQELPTCTVPCTETQIWGKAGSSFPALRAGKYGAWSLIHIISIHTTQIKDLINTSNKYATGSVPDYIPALAVTGANPDPGMQIWHTHYQQRDGDDHTIGQAPTNGTFTTGHNPNGGDHGGDAGGCTISTVGITSSKDVQFIQVGPGTTCSSTKLRN
jgi:hypothetical protein